MARLYSSGFELNSVTAGIDFHLKDDTGGALTIDSVVKRSGNYSLKVSGLTSGARALASFRYIGTASSGPFYARAYLAVSAYPGIKVGIMRMSGGTVPIIVRLNTSGTLELADEDGVIGTSASAIPNDTSWHRIEIEFDGTGAGSTDILRLYVDGVAVVESTTRDILGTVHTLDLGGNSGAEANSTGTWYWDDIAINDSTGAAETTLPGEGSIIIMRPNGEGDGDTGVSRIGTDSGSNFGQVDEETPNGVTDGLSLTTASSVFWVDCEPSPAAINSGDTIKFVAVGAQIALNSAGSGQWTVSIKSQSAGTEVDGPNITIASTTYAVHDDSSGLQQYKLTQYVDPQGGGPWTKALLDTMQIGGKTNDGTPPTDVSTLWALVEYVAAAGGVPPDTDFLFYQVKQGWRR